MVGHEFQQHHPDAAPAGLAPFLAARDDTVVDALRTISAAAQAQRVTLDRERGAFVIQTPGTPEAIVLHPWMLLLDADRPRQLAPFPSDRRALIEAAVLRAWKQMVEDLHASVLLGEFVVIAREDSPLSRQLVELPDTAWSTFQIEDWEHSVAVCAYTKSRLFDVCFLHASSKELPVLEKAAPNIATNRNWEPLRPSKTSSATERAIKILLEMYPVDKPGPEIGNKEVYAAYVEACGSTPASSKETVLRILGRLPRLVTTQQKHEEQE